MVYPSQLIPQQTALPEEQFGTTHITPQRIFIQDAVNFCFWSKKGNPRWQVEFPKAKINNGWNALTASFERAIQEGIPILEAEYLETITDKEARNIFRGINQTQIPLVEERVNILKETGKILAENFSGNIELLLRKADYDAASIAKSVIDNFPSFRDTSILEGKKVHFFKRAQITAYDLSLLKNLHIKSIDTLTAFADYKLPQILRFFGVLRYKKPLAKKIDRMELIPKHCREEIEIRAATVQVCERLSRMLKFPAAIVDNALWLLSQNIKEEMKPYHRTLTSFY